MPYYFFFLFPVFFFAFFVLILFILSHLGWNRLSSKYEYTEVFEGRYLAIFSARINWVNYTAVLDFKFNATSLYIKPNFLFQFFHPPILIPWTAIVKAEPWWMPFIRQTELTIGRDRPVHLIIPERAYEKIKEFIQF